MTNCCKASKLHMGSCEMSIWKTALIETKRMEIQWESTLDESSYS